MSVDRLIPRAVLLLLTVVLVGCSSDQAEKTESGKTEPAKTDLTIREADSLAIQTTLTEVASRWRFQDKAVLYEQEFDYFRFEYSYDDYLEIDHVKNMNADSVFTFNVKGIEFFGRDSAAVKVEVVFKGETGNLSYDYDTYRMYRYQDRWVRPSFSAPKLQIAFEEARRSADSAAAAEEDLEF